MSIIHSSLLLGAGAAAGGYQIERSLRFNSSDSASLSRTPASAGNRRIFTFSCWLKKSGVDTSRRYILFSAYSSGSVYFTLEFETNNLKVFDGISIGGGLSTSAVFRDSSAWYHIVLSADTTQATASNRIRLYVNGTEQTLSGTQPAQNADLNINTAVAHRIGAIDAGGIFHVLDGYLAECYLIDGQQLTPSSFTEVSATTGQLIPKAYTGSYGTNGFHLPFSDNSTAAALGTDTSGNGNSWTVNNIAPSNGATYSNRGSLSSSPPTLSGTISDIFDGLLNSSNAFSVNQANAGVTINFSPALPSGSSVKLVGGVYGTAGSNNSLQVNGTGYAQSLPASTGTYTEIVEVSVPAGASGITSIYIYREGISTFNFALYGIKVNDVLLVDGAAGDSLVDTPTSYGTDTYVGGEVRGNYCTLNPLTSSGGTYSQGNLRFVGPADYRRSNGTIAVSTGKWYWEVTLANGPYSPRTSSSQWNAFGFGLSSVSHSTTPSSAVTDAVVLQDNGYFKNFSSSVTDVGTAFSSGDVLSCAVDLDANTFTFRRNNTQVATGTIGGTAGRELVPIIISYNDWYGVMDCNFGQRPFAYTAPSGFKALCDTNLPEGTITTSGTYTGNGVADGPFVYLNGVPTAMTVGGNAVTFGTHADKLSNGFKLRTTSTTYNQNALSYSYSITTTGAKFKFARAQPNP